MQLLHLSGPSGWGRQWTAVGLRFDGVFAGVVVSVRRAVCPWYAECRLQR